MKHIHTTPPIFFFFESLQNQGSLLVKQKKKNTKQSTVYSDKISGKIEIDKNISERRHVV